MGKSGTLYGPKLGLYVPTDWGARWRAARAAAGSRLVNIVSWGDSILQGYYASDLREKNYVGYAVAQLRSTYGDGGSGFLSSANATGIGATGATYITLTGAWTFTAAAINESSINNNVAATGTITIPNVRGRFLDYWWVRGAAASGVNVVVDGGAPTAVNTGGGSVDLFKTTIDTGTAGPHTVVVTVTSGVTVFVGVNGYNSTGLVQHNMGLAGRTSASGALTTFLAGGKTSGSVSITDFSPDLFVYELAVNDVGAAVSGDSYEANLHRACKLARNYSNGVADIVIVTHHVGNLTDTNNLFSRYSDRAQAICESWGAVHLNMWPIGRNSWDYWNSLGYWGVTNGSAGSAGTDVVHPSDAGFAVIGNQLLSVLAA